MNDDYAGNELRENGLACSAQSSHNIARTFTDVTDRTQEQYRQSNTSSSVLSYVPLCLQYTSIYVILIVYNNDIVKSLNSRNCEKHFNETFLFCMK